MSIHGVAFTVSWVASATLGHLQAVQSPRQDKNIGKCYPI